MLLFNANIVHLKKTINGLNKLTYNKILIFKINKELNVTVKKK